MSKLLPENASYFQIVNIVIDPIKLWVELELIDPIALKNHILQFHELAYFSISKDHDDNDGCYTICDIELTRSHNVKEILSSLGYRFTGNSTLKEIDSVYHLHLEGDVCMDIVSAEYRYDAPT